MTKTNDIKVKVDTLKTIIHEMESVAIAFSGGVDSSTLAKACYDCLGDSCIAITALSPVVSKYELDWIDLIIKKIGLHHTFVESDEMDDENFLKNCPQRCYFCKAKDIDVITAYAREHGYNIVADGNNADDQNDYRPGRKAALEKGVRSPLDEAGLTKKEIRELARSWDLPNWNKPHDACLASRIPYGTRITSENLSRVDRAEQFLRSFNFIQLRVRYHGDVARIEVPAEDFKTILKLKDNIIEKFKEIGFTYITLDLAGFRSGSMNEVLK